MSRLAVHIFARTGVVFLAVLATLTGIVWVTQALRRFDLVTAKGQAIATYLGMTFLAVPFLTTVVAPFALAIAIIVVLNAMHSDSELVAINAAGGSHRQIARPFVMLGLIVGIWVAFISLFAGPQALQTLRDMTNRIRADVVANVLQPGRFVEIDEDFTFHIRNRAGDGSLEGLFIYDSRDPVFLFTYTAERGRVVEALGRSLVVMENGTIERTRRADQSSTFVAFGSYGFDLSELQPEGTDRPYQVNERTIVELITTPVDDPFRAKREDQFQAEIHNRLTVGVYPLLMVLAVLVFMGLPRTTRGGRAAAVVSAMLAATGVRIAGFLVAGAAGSNAALIPLVWAVPGGLMVVLGAAFWAGRQPALPGFVTDAADRVAEWARALAARAVKAGGS
ncbi:LptF/LptG family permease [Chthonobacter rhizosphaerae]|uniref:LptF/LptG family permease n=1 Tax=Chthonobacter rhizosphaerae TaxID=2735553 RepID=UPI0015EF8D4F|nr:LptF/LptG family permease [Chthonobacter rhizosphaerae]